MSSVMSKDNGTVVLDRLTGGAHTTKEPERHWTVCDSNQDGVVKYTIHAYQGMRAPEAWPNGGKKWCQRKYAKV
jgi:hypothetical protein